MMTSFITKKKKTRSIHHLGFAIFSYSTLSKPFFFFCFPRPEGGGVGSPEPPSISSFPTEGHNLIDTIT